MRGSPIRASLLATIAAAVLALAPAVASAGQIVFVRQAGASSSETNLWVMNEDGSSQRMLLAQNQNGDAVESLNQPNLLPTGVDLAFQGATGLPGGGCGVNCVGVYTLVGGEVRRISSPVVPCHTTVDGSCSLSDIDNGPTLTDDGRVLYLHTGTGVGVECGLFCGIYAAAGNSYIVQPVLGGAPNQWPWPINTYEPPAEEGGYAVAPVADPANPELILYAGIEDNGCAEAYKCHPLVVDNASGQSYIVSDDDQRQDAYTWSPNGEYIADVEGGTEPGIWVYKNAKEPSPGTVEHAWYVMATPSSTPSGGGFTGDLSLTNAGNIIFSSGGDVYSLAQSGCWGASAPEATEPEKPNCTLAEAKQLTTSGLDGDATWTESTQPIIVNAPPASAPGPRPGPRPIEHVARGGARASRERRLADQPHLARGQRTGNVHAQASAADRHELLLWPQRARERRARVHPVTQWAQGGQELRRAEQAERAQAPLHTLGDRRHPDVLRSRRCQHGALRRSGLGAQEARARHLHAAGHRHGVGQAVDAKLAALHDREQVGNLGLWPESGSSRSSTEPAALTGRIRSRCQSVPLSGAGRGFVPVGSSAALQSGRGCLRRCGIGRTR